MTIRATIASIGMLHPWNVAGVGLDARAAAELGVRVVSAIAAVSAQDASGVRLVSAVPLDALEAQLRALPWPVINAVRIGALPDAAAIAAVQRAVRMRRLPIVVDPVMRASTGEALVAEDAIAAMREWLAMNDAIVTPNVDEAAALCGRDAVAADAGRLLRSYGARAVVVKGGHASGDPVDTVADADGVFEMRGGRLAGDMRGTGCLFAFALASELGAGSPLREAMRAAHQFVRDKIERAVCFAGFAVAY